MKVSPAGSMASGLALAAAGLSGVLYAQTVNLRPGMYEFTSVLDMQLPPEVSAKMGPMLAQPRVTQHCITQTDLDHVSQKLAEGQPHGDQGCTISERSVVGNEVKFTQQCANGATRHFEGTFMSDSFKALMVMTNQAGRPPVTIRMTARRTGECSK